MRRRSPALVMLVAAACTPAGEVPPAEAAEWSIDAGEFAFLTRRDGDGEIYLATGSDSAAVNLTRSPAFEGFPDWSPDGARIAFDSDRAGNYNREIYVMAADGSDVVRLTDHPGHDYGPQWSPAGDWILFASTRGTEFDPAKRNFEAFRAQLYKVRPDGTDLQRVTQNDVYDQTPAWLPDGRIVFCREIERRGALWILDADGTNERVLIDGPDYECSPDVSPDGEWIAYRATRGDSAQLYVARIDGTAQRRVPTSHRLNYEPDWSPDGRWLCFTAGPSDDSLDVYAIRIDGTQERRLAASTVRDQACAWRPRPR